jgi:hypothetical protein
VDGDRGPPSRLSWLDSIWMYGLSTLERKRIFVNRNVKPQCEIVHVNVALAKMLCCKIYGYCKKMFDGTEFEFLPEFVLYRLLVFNQVSWIFLLGFVMKVIWYFVAHYLISLSLSLNHTYTHTHAYTHLHKQAY